MYIKRGVKVSLWDGKEALQPDDRIRLKIVADGYTHVAVFTQGEGEAGDSAPLLLLYESQLDPSGETLLPRTWAVDDAPGPERLVVALGKRPLGARDIEDETASSQGEIWIRRLLLPKDTDKTGTASEDEVPGATR